MTEVVEARPVEESTVAGLAIPDDRDALVRPAASVEDIAGAFSSYQELKRRLLTDDDYQTWRERGQQRSFVKRSGWRKLAVAFGVSFEKRDEKILRRDPDDPNSPPVYAEFVIRAIAPNGRFVDGWGACSVEEERFQNPRARTKLHHDLPSTAETRAKNRAAADLFGMGEVSAEEASDESQVNTATRETGRTARSRAQGSSDQTSGGEPSSPASRGRPAPGSPPDQTPGSEDSMTDARASDSPPSGPGLFPLVVERYGSKTKLLKEAHQRWGVATMDELTEERLKELLT